MATLFIFTITGQIVWSYFAWCFVSRLVRIMIFMYRMGWKEVRSIYIRDWIDIIINPPDKLGATYYPGKRGKEMRQRDERDPSTVCGPT